MSFSLLSQEASPSEATRETINAGLLVSARPGQVPCASGRDLDVVLYLTVVQANVLLLEACTFKPTMKSNASPNRARLVHARRVVRLIATASEV